MCSHPCGDKGSRRRFRFCMRGAPGMPGCSPVEEMEGSEPCNLDVSCVRKYLYWFFILSLFYFPANLYWTRFSYASNVYSNYHFFKVGENGEIGNPVLGPVVEDSKKEGELAQEVLLMHRVAKGRNWNLVNVMSIRVMQRQVSYQLKNILECRNRIIGFLYGKQVLMFNTSIQYQSV